MASWRSQKTVEAAIRSAVCNNSRLAENLLSIFGLIRNAKKSPKTHRELHKKKTLPPHRSGTPKGAKFGSEISHKISPKAIEWLHPYNFWNLKDVPNEMLVFQGREPPKIDAKTVKKTLKNEARKKILKRTKFAHHSSLKKDPKTTKNS